MRKYYRIVALLALTYLAAPVAAEEVKEPRRTRVGLGVQVVPSYPGSNDHSLRPLIDVARTRGKQEYEFEAPDESFGFPVIRTGGLAFGPVLGFEGGRSADDVGTTLRKVGFTVEVGTFVQYTWSESFRVRGEVRQGIGGHKGIVGTIGADYVMREGNDWLLSVGPRLTLADRKYHQAYYSVRPEEVSSSGLPAYSAGGGESAIGATAGFITQLTPRWGIYAYAKYDRLVGAPAGSPIVRRYGSRDQLSGGLALTYTFGRGL